MDHALTVEDNGPATDVDVRANSANAYNIDILINGNHVEALVDTGACVTMASQELCNQLVGCKIEPAGDSAPLQGVVPGSKIDVVGCLNVAINIGQF